MCFFYKGTAERHPVTLIIIVLLLPFSQSCCFSLFHVILQLVASGQHFLDSKMPNQSGCISHQIPHHTELTSHQMPGVCPGEGGGGGRSWIWLIHYFRCASFTDQSEIIVYRDISKLIGCQPYRGHRLPLNKKNIYLSIDIKSEMEFQSTNLFATLVSMKATEVRWTVWQWTEFFFSFLFYFLFFFMGSFWFHLEINLIDRDWSHPKSCSLRKNKHRFKIPRYLVKEAFIGTTAFWYRYHAFRMFIAYIFIYTGNVANTRLNKTHIFS